MTVQNPEAVPVVNDTLQADYLGVNPSLFGVGINQSDIEGEPYLEVVEKVVQIVSGLLVAERIKKVSDLKNPAKIQEIKAELLKQLFKEESLPDIVSFQNGNIIVHRSSLLSFITEHLARAEIRKAA